MKPPILLAGFVFASSGALAAFNSAAARAILADYQDALLTVRCVVKAQVVVNGAPMGNERESVSSVPGTVVTADGWVVVSGFQLNPMATLVRKPMKTERGGQTIEFEMKSRIESLHYRLSDQSEVGARLVTEDEDLGLALLAPALKPGDASPKFHPVSWDRLAAASAFTRYLVVGRASEAFKHEPLIDLGTIGAALDKPRRLYLQDYGHPLPFLGSPFVDLSGRLLGLGALNLRPPEDLASGLIESWPVAVIVPAQDVREWVRRSQKTGEGPAPAPPVEAATERPAESDPALALAVQKQNDRSVVLIEGSIKFNCGNCAEEHESNVETVGTVLDGSGLVVAGNDGEGASNKYLEQNLRFILSDRSEVPAEIVLEDDDLRLAVLAPAAKGGAPPPTLQPVTLAPEVEANVFDEVVTLGRLDRTRRYLSAIAVGRVIARVSKPRPFLKIKADPAGPHEDGLPVFLPNGRFLGIQAPEPPSAAGESGEGSLLRGLSFEERTPVRVVPVTALIGLLEQARKAQAKAAETPAAPKP